MVEAEGLSRLPMIVPEDATEPLETLDATGTLAHIVLGSDQPVVQALVIPFPVIM